MTIGSRSLSFSLPQISFSTITEISEKVRHSLNDLSTSTPFQSMRNTPRRFKNLFKNKIVLIGGACGLFLLLLIGFALKTATQTPSASTDRPEVGKPYASQPVDKSFSFPIKDETGKKVSTIKYTIEVAELRNEIVHKGQLVPIIKGRTALALNIKLTNNFNKPVNVNVRDYVRLSVNGKNEKFAPELHNDPVESQAGSSRNTWAGFVINETDSKLVLHIGEYVGENASGKKETVALTLK